MDLKTFATRSELLAAVGEHLIARVDAALQTRERALLALSGGSTPLPLYRWLADCALDWSRITFSLVDERWVDTESPASNEYQLRAALAPALAAGAGFIGMKNPASSAKQGLAACEAIWQGLALPFDLVLLGMGEDGHTASLFPRARGLLEALDRRRDALCAAIDAEPSAVTGPFTERMSLTLRAILAARSLDLLVTGANKRAVLEQALDSDDVPAAPIAAVLQQTDTPVRAWWAP